LFEKNGIPLYIQLKNELLNDIRKNYHTNDIIPSEPLIEQKYNVSRITVRRAIDELVKEGVLEKKQGLGTFIKEKKILYKANHIGSLSQRLLKQKHILETKSIEYEIIQNENENEFLKCNKLLCIKRFRILDNVPFAIMKNYIDINLVPNIQEKFNIESLYEFYQKEFDIKFYNAKETVEATLSNKEQSNILNIKENSALLSLKRLSFDKNNNPIEYSNIKIKADMYKHQIMISSIN